MPLLPLSKPLQFALVLAIIANLTILTDLANYRSPVNFGWMFGVPILLALLSNLTIVSRTLMSAVLLVLSLLAMMLTAEVFGLGT